jgi:hypothetical protein
MSHDADKILVWLNPALDFTFPYEPGMLYSDVAWTGDAYDSNDPVGPALMDIQEVPVSVLNGDAGPLSSNQQWASVLGRIWAGSGNDGSGPSLTALDLGDILNADPFAYNPYQNANYNNPAQAAETGAGGAGLNAGRDYFFTPSPSDPKSSIDGRFSLGSSSSDITYALVPLGDSDKPQTDNTTYTTTSIVGQATKDIHSTTSSYESGASFILMQPLKGLPFNFNVNMSATMTNGNTLTWEDDWSSQVTSGNSTIMQAIIEAPQAGGMFNSSNYTLGWLEDWTSIDVYQDNVYGTFMFWPTSD